MKDVDEKRVENEEEKTERGEKRSQIETIFNPTYKETTPLPL